MLPAQRPMADGSDHTCEPSTGARDDGMPTAAPTSSAELATGTGTAGAGADGEYEPL
ncbi:hypothetical protein [Micromonospora echinofusca]|uniref:Uncharacterized protein n=1 Tax=Micromonospora echinofusca TaxID=47858 RepID=A0ABS3VYQ2_MICEH|nr:hypothetical protein [Micromonospora echinofusca]MBO4209669.1 hypothetical protein [Micromonospora echinofusca]